MVRSELTIPVGDEGHLGRTGGLYESLEARIAAVPGGGKGVAFNIEFGARIGVPKPGGEAGNVIHPDMPLIGPGVHREPGSSGLHGQARKVQELGAGGGAASISKQGNLIQIHRQGDHGSRSSGALR